MIDKLPISLISTLATPSLPQTGEPHLVYVLFELQGTQKNQSIPADIALLIDSSESMHIRLMSDIHFAQLVRAGQAQEVMTDGVPAFQLSAVPNETLKKFPRKLDYVIQALQVVSEYIRPVDRFSLTAFASRAHILIPSSPGFDRLRLNQAAGELEYLNLGDGTNIATGLATAFTEVRRIQNQHFAKRIILLTDGYTRNVQDCYDWAQQARTVGLPLTTMGVGNEFNEDLLIPLADLTGGNAYYIENPDQIPKAFRQELGVAFRISLRNLVLHFYLTDGVTLRNAYRVSPELGRFDRVIGDERHYQLVLGDYDPGMPVALLVEFIIPGWDDGLHLLASAQLRWENQEQIGSPKNHTNEIMVKIETKTSVEQDHRVMNIVERVGAYQFGKRALDDAQHGKDQISAILRLRQAATRLSELGENLLADTLLRQADLLERTGALDPGETKKLRYKTRQLIRQLSTNNETNNEMKSANNTQST